MAKPHERIEQLHSRREELKTQLAQVGDLRPGSLVERYRRCGKANCHCAGEGAEGHGPTWSLTREVGGKTITTIIPSAAVENTRGQIAEYKRFRSLAKELVETSERLCDAQLETPEAASQEVAKKGGSKRSLKRKSSAKSKDS
jgi:hypothetical protein